jgi:predicted solute-binding protein
LFVNADKQQGEHLHNENVTVAGITIVSAELRQYTDDSFRILNAAESYKTEFTDMVAAAAEKTGLPKKVLSKYFKARFKEATKEATEQGEIFEALDRALDGSAS